MQVISSAVNAVLLVTVGVVVANILEPVYEQLQEWAPLVGVHEIQLAAETDNLRRVSLLLRIGELQRTKLMDAEKAFDAYARGFREDPSTEAAKEQLEGATWVWEQYTGAMKVLTELKGEQILDRLRRAAPERMHAHHVAAAHVGEQLADGRLRGHDRDVDPVALDQVGVRRPVDQRDRASRADPLGQHARHDVRLVVGGERDEQVHLGDAFLGEHGPTIDTIRTIKLDPDNADIVWEMLNIVYEGGVQTQQLTEDLQVRMNELYERERPRWETLDIAALVNEAAREASVYTAVTLAEYYRQMGLNCLLLADSTSRWAQALREMSGRLEEIPGDEAFPAYLESRIASFYERAGLVELNSGERGSVTIGGAVSPAGGNFEEPVTQATLKMVGAFLGLSRERSDARRYPAIQPLDSWSHYKSLVNAKELKIARNVLRRGSEVSQMMKVVGEEGTHIDDFELYLKSEFLDYVYLQQNTFDEVDQGCSPERQRYMFGKIVNILETKFRFNNKDVARRFFLELRQICIDWNYSPFKSPKFEELEAKIDAKVKELHHA